MKTLKNHLKFTTKQVLLIIENFDSMTTKQLAEKANIQPKQVRSIYRKYGLKRSDNCQFPKGHKPWNKGKHYDNGATETQFKKGITPHNTKPVGSKRMCKDGYYEIKTENHKWISLHKHVWEKHFGQIPSRNIVVFKPGADKLNFSIDDLECISRAENILRNQNRKKAAAAMRIVWKNKKEEVIDITNTEKLMFG